MPVEHIDPWRSEQLLTYRDAATGLRAVIAFDDLTLGPGFGGVRWKAYPTTEAAVREAQRLAAAMTMKHALAELPYGGAKSVVLHDGRERDEAQRRALFAAFGDVVAATGGRYIPGVDMGTTLADMEVIRSRGAKVYCADVDPAPWTARCACACHPCRATPVSRPRRSSTSTSTSSPPWAAAATTASS